MSTINALILEDDPNSLEILARLLKAHQVTSVGVDDPAKIDDVLSQSPSIDLVFLDLEMPNMDGYEVLAYLRKRIGANVRVIACTVHVNEINHARERGFDGFIGKPLKPAKFPDQLQRLLAGQQVWEAK